MAASLSASGKGKCELISDSSNNICAALLFRSSSIYMRINSAPFQRRRQFFRFKLISVLLSSTVTPAAVGIGLTQEDHTERFKSLHAAESNLKETMCLSRRCGRGKQNGEEDVE